MKRLAVFATLVLAVAAGAGRLAAQFRPEQIAREAGPGRVPPDGRDRPRRSPSARA